MKYLYKYPQAPFPYGDLVETNRRRNRTEMEYELLDTGVFDEDRYWRIEVEYAKHDPTDICALITVTNEGPEADTLHVLPHLWFRDTWSWGREHTEPNIRHEGIAGEPGALVAEHWRAGVYHLAAAPADDDTAPAPLACDNVTNHPRVWGDRARTAYPKDGINDHVVAGAATVNPHVTGTKAAWWYRLEVPAGQSRTIRLRLWSPTDGDQPFIPAVTGHPPSGRAARAVGARRMSVRAETRRRVRAPHRLDQSALSGRAARRSPNGTASGAVCRTAP
jgi:hypothetical protein